MQLSQILSTYLTCSPAWTPLVFYSNSVILKKAAICMRQGRSAEGSGTNLERVSGRRTGQLYTVS